MTQEKHRLKEFLTQSVTIDSPILEEYLQKWQPIDHLRKTILTQEGNTERYLYFVLSGLQKSYFLHNGKEHIMFFSYAPSLSGVIESFLTQTPSKYFLETITTSQFLQISYTDHNKLINKHRPLETLFRRLTERFLVEVIGRHHEMLAYNVETRFRLFTKRSPHLLNMVSQKDMASYLRIDPTNFSKLINSIKL